MVREYKDSGITWIGRIPQDWNTTKLGSLYTQRNEKVSDKDYAPLSVTMQGILPQLETAAKTDDGDNRKLVKKGDFAINSRSDRRGSCGISPYDGSVSLINTILKPRGEMNPNFYNWLFHTSPFADEFYKWGHGIVDDLWTTRWQEMKNISVVIPSLEEQQHIADYLDKKCAEIDGLIELQEQMIARLTDYRQSIITEAVTKGINPNAQLVPSGISWIGCIPEGWEISRFKSYINLHNEKGSESAKIKVNLENIESKSGRYLPSDSRYEGEGTSFKKGDVLFRKLRPYLAKVLAPNFEGSAMGDIYVFRPTAKVDAYFLKFALLSDTFVNIVDSSTYGTKMPRANWEFISCMPIILPPLNEQKDIASYLEGKCAEIDLLITVKQQKIEMLKDYKKSLIFECVTGKKEIK